jgi:hypothetical protein
VHSLILAAAVAAMPGSPAEAPVATKADYRKWPSSYDWYLATPQAVHSMGKAGRAVLRCKVTDFGDLARCKIAEEDPKGFGFGKAAMRLRTSIKMTPTPKGQERWLLIPFSWDKGEPYLPPTL